MTVLPYVIVFGSAAAIVAYQVRVLYRSRGRNVWWQRVRPLGWISVALFFFLSYATLLWPALPFAVSLLPGAALIALNLARLFGQYRSERDEVRRDRQLGEPTHAYLSSTSSIFLTVGLASALIMLVSASNATAAAASNLLLYLSLMLAGASIVHYFYRRARRHHENVVIALHRAAERASARRPATAGSVRPLGAKPDHP
ncbi:hypothetical protein [Rhodococcoides fascians]|jgi:hypothetical protein|uniref:hypothetical protein n=1 Tax=Rhodococcoides fascians TaxID=1828 RepID=UPI00056AD1E2|nr:hypothetical protein [Rhodococcus fascians]